jgi:hypothetical protein
VNSEWVRMLKETVVGYYKELSCNLTLRTKEVNEKLSLDSLCPVRVSKRTPVEYKLEASLLESS